MACLNYRTSCGFKISCFKVYLMIAEIYTLKKKQKQTTMYTVKLSIFYIYEYIHIYANIFMSFYVYTYLYMYMHKYIYPYVHNLCGTYDIFI